MPTSGTRAGGAVWSRRSSWRAAAPAPACFVVADGLALPVREAGCDVAVSGLVLNFLPAPGAAVAEASRVVRPGGLVAAYVWAPASRICGSRSRPGRAPPPATSPASPSPPGTGCVTGSAIPCRRGRMGRSRSLPAHGRSRAESPAAPAPDSADTLR
ncbi:methyltransferase domain-containing protein [Streptomyces vinaceus]|nr:methyltransferase domain-containing protein [Streptomyces vinaceus]